MALTAAALTASFSAGLIALAVAGCGGHAATRQDVIAQGNAICSDTLRSIRSTPSPAGSQRSLPALSAYLRKVVPLVGKEVKSIAALPRPAADRATLNRFVAATRTMGTQYRALAAATKHGDAGGVAQALSALASNPAPALARRYGLTQCAGVAGTVR